MQLEEGISHLPLLDSSMRATPLTPSEWRSRLEAVNKIDSSLNTKETNCILLDVRNGTTVNLAACRCLLKLVFV